MSATPERQWDDRFDRLLVAAQLWLQGHRSRSWTLARLGNLISDYRFHRWTRKGGTW